MISITYELIKLSYNSGMRAKKALKIIFYFAIGGILFSGYLSYMELWGGGCEDALVQCGSNFSLFNLPACVYGFFMYLTIFVIATIGLRSKE